MTSTTTVTLAGQEVRLERPSARKASRALALLRALTKAVPEVREEWAKFTAEYEATNLVELDRTQARLRFPPRPLYDELGEPLREPATIGDRPNPRAGDVVFLPSPIDRMTEEDWAESDHKLKLPKSPSQGEVAAAVFDTALELAEDHVYRLLALFLIPNDDVARYWKSGELPERLEERANDLLDDAFGDELMELAVVVGELVDDTFVRKARDLGDRLGNVGRLFGINRKSRQPETPTSSTPPPAPSTSPSSSSSDGPEDSTPPSSTASPEPTAAESAAPSSTSPGTSSPSSSSESRTTPSESAPSENEPTAAAA